MFDFSPLQASFAELQVAVDRARYCEESAIPMRMRPVQRHLRMLCLLPNMLESRRMQEIGLRNSDELPDEPIVQAAYELVHRLHETFDDALLPYIDHDRLPELAEFLENLELESAIGGD